MNPSLVFLNQFTDAASKKSHLKVNSSAHTLYLPPFYCKSNKATSKHPISAMLQ